MKVLQYIKANSKKATLAIFAATAIAVPAIAFAGFFPERPIKDWNNTTDRGGFDKVVFNSFVNTPYYGDERHFFDAREGVGNDAADNYKDVLGGVDAGDELTLRVYVHNNGNQDLNGENYDGPTVAKDAKVRFKLPTGTAQNLKATSYISASNATPAVVSDTSEFVGENAFSLEYIPGSATLVTGHNGGTGFALSDSIVTDGATIGYNQLNGVLPGCFEYQAFVYIKVKVKAPAVEFEKKVKVGDGSYQDSAHAKPGDIAKWLITYKNVGTAQLNNTTIKDTLPANLDVVDGSVKLVDAAHKNGLALDDEDLFDSNGVNAGSYTSGSNGYITFDTKIAAASELEECVTTLKNIARVRADDVTQQEDDATVIVTKENCDEVTPTYSCDLLELKKLGNLKYQFTAKATATGGATIKQYRYDFGDKTEVMVTDKTVVEHTYAKSGDYAASLTVDFNVDGAVQSKSGESCKVVINTEKEVENCPIPGKENLPKNSPDCVTPELPKTGPADMIGIFAAATIAAGFAHKIVLSRRFL